MYHVKEEGRNGWEFFSKPLERIAHFQVELENKLRDAVDREDFELYYQPIVETGTLSIVKMEALIRWFPEGEKPISPFHFIPIAERIGLINQIGYWVIRNACEQIRAWDARKLTAARISINLAATQFTDDNLVENIENILKEMGVAGERIEIEIEITESLLVENLEKVRSVLAEIKKLNITVAIDDFGTGYSSLRYLNVLPIDNLKIDQAFVKNIVDNSGDQSIVKAIVSLGHNLNFRIVAEGVEDSQSYEYLRLLGCDYIQGYYFFKPMPACDLTSILQKGRATHQPKKSLG